MLKHGQKTNPSNTTNNTSAPAKTSTSGNGIKIEGTTAGDNWEVMIYPAKKESDSWLGNVSLKIDGLVSFEGCRIRENKQEALFLAFPSRKITNDQGEESWKDMIFPGSKEFRQALTAKAESYLSEDCWEKFQAEEEYLSFRPTYDEVEGGIAPRNGCYGFMQGNQNGLWYINNISIVRDFDGNPKVRYPGLTPKSEDGKPILSKSGYPIENIHGRPAKKETRAAIADAILKAILS